VAFVLADMPVHKFALGAAAPLSRMDRPTVAGGPREPLAARGSAPSSSSSSSSHGIAPSKSRDGGMCRQASPIPGGSRRTTKTAPAPVHVPRIDRQQVPASESVSGWNPRPLPVPSALRVPDILLGTLAPPSVRRLAVLPVRPAEGHVAAAAAASTLATARGALDPIIGLRRQDQRAMPWMLLADGDLAGDPDAAFNGRKEQTTSEPAVVVVAAGGGPGRVPATGSALLWPAALLPPSAVSLAGYQPHPLAAAASSFGSAPLPPPWVVNDWIRRQTIVELLRRKHLDEAAEGPPRHLAGCLDGTLAVRPDLLGRRTAFVSGGGRGAATTAASVAATMAGPLLAATLAAATDADPSRSSRWVPEGGRALASSSSSPSDLSSLCSSAIVKPSKKQPRVPATSRVTSHPRQRKRRRRTGAGAAASADSEDPAEPSRHLRLCRAGVAQGGAARYGPSRSIPMARECDAQFTTRYQCLLRQQIEYFEADEFALHAKAQGRNVPIQMGQVGIRCVHCARRWAPPQQDKKKKESESGECARGPERMVRGALYYPTRLSSLYQAVQNMSRNHFLCRTCPSAPSEVLDRISTARDAKPERSAGAGKAYFGRSAEAVGIVAAAVAATAAAEGGASEAGACSSAGVMGRDEIVECCL
jgi:hypothetical protein